jgi:alpha-1,3-rhamnosyl/mannosyltransferase
MVKGIRIPGMARVLFHTEAIRQPLTGIGRYAQALGAALIAETAHTPETAHASETAHAPDTPQPEVLCRPRAPDAPPEAGRVSYGWRRRLRGVPGAYALAHRRSERRFRDLAAEADCDLYHEPNFVLRRFEGPGVVTCHDLAHLRFPRQQPRQRRAFLDRHVPDSLARAARIIVPTTFVREELVDLLSVDRRKIRVVPEGVDPVFRPRPGETLAPALQRLGLTPGGYLLSVGTIEPRKNLMTLAAAFANLPAPLRARFPLVLAGAPGWHGEALRRVLAPLLAEGSARLLGYVPDDALPLLYAGARGFAFLSHYEGFGLPALEALASGAPTLTSDAPSLVEVTGDAALHTPSGDVDAAGAALERLLTDTALRSPLTRRGPERAAALTWTRAAAETRAVYREILGGDAAEGGVGAAA